MVCRSLYDVHRSDPHGGRRGTSELRLPVSPCNLCSAIAQKGESSGRVWPLPVAGDLRCFVIACHAAGTWDLRCPDEGAFPFRLLRHSQWSGAMAHFVEESGLLPISICILPTLPPALPAPPASAFKASKKDHASRPLAGLGTSGVLKPYAARMADGRRPLPRTCPRRASHGPPEAHTYT